MNNKPNWRVRFEKAFTPYSTDDAIRKAIEEKNRKIPKKLYRFRSYDKEHPQYTEDEMSGKLCFQPRSNLNDPYDGTIMQKYSDPLEYLKKHLFIKKEILENSLEQIYSKDIGSKIANYLLAEYKRNNPCIQNVSPSDCQSILNSTIETTSDYVRGCNNGFKNNLDLYSQIVCFTEELTSLPMWSHYSKGHQGYCFEYNFHQLDLNNIPSKFYIDRLVPVNYVDKLYDFADVMLSFSDKYKDMESYPCSADYFFRSFVIHKLQDWSYEREWRLIMGIGELTALYKTPIDYTKHPIFEQSALVDLMNTPHPIQILKPNAIYLGVNVEPDIREILISHALKHGISVYQMELTLTGLQASLIRECNP